MVSFRFISSGYSSFEVFVLFISNQNIESLVRIIKQQSGRDLMNCHFFFIDALLQNYCQLQSLYGCRLIIRKSTNQIPFTIH